MKVKSQIQILKVWKFTWLNIHTHITICKGLTPKSNKQTFKIYMKSTIISPKYTYLKIEDPPIIKNKTNSFWILMDALKDRLLKISSYKIYKLEDKY